MSRTWSILPQRSSFTDTSSKLPNSRRKSRQKLGFILTSILTLHLNSVFDAPIQFRGRKWLIPITSLSEIKFGWKLTVVLSRLSAFPWGYSHFDRTSNSHFIFFNNKNKKNKNYFFFNFYKIQRKLGGPLECKIWAMSQSDINGGESFSASELNCKVNVRGFLLGLAKFEFYATIENLN